MKDPKYNELLRKLDCEYAPVAIRMCLEKPDAPRYRGEKTAFCAYMKYCQTTREHFYIQEEDDACYGKLAMGMIESGMKNTEAAKEMREKYLVSPEKTALAITIANRERELSLIHI